MEIVQRLKSLADEYANKYGNIPMNWSDVYDLENDYKQTWPNNSDPGCYAIFDDQMSLLYLGKASHLGSRLASYFKYDSTRHKGIAKKPRSWSKSPRFVLTVGLRNSFEAPSLEEYLIQELQPPDNRIGIRL